MRFMAQLVMIVEVLIAKRDPEHALAHQRYHLVFDQLRSPHIAKARRKPPRQPHRPIRRPKHQDHKHHERREHERHDHEWHERQAWCAHHPYECGAPSYAYAPPPPVVYAPPPVVYAPPPVVYAPPPVVYAPPVVAAPGLNIVVPIHIK
jgi:hypothetical protein